MHSKENIKLDKYAKRLAALKLDFKIASGKLRIIDIGDGLAAGLGGFEDTPVQATLLHDLHEASGVSLVTAFGELPYNAMHPKTLHIPLVLRQISSEKACMDVGDLSSRPEYLLPFSEGGRIQSYVSNDWGRKLKNVAVTPIALIAMEMHKLLWYMLMQKRMPAEDYEKVLYWTNDSGPDIDISRINIQNGAFIKIADRSTGGSDEVYYAKNDVEVRDRLRSLSKAYHSNSEQYKKHIFIIEPAYFTLKRHQDKDYNVTGRAFITLTFNTNTRALDVKIASAKWILPSQQMRGDKSPEQILSNASHSSGTLELSSDELDTLSKAILDSYGEVFKASFEHDNLMEYCKDAPEMNSFLSCLRPDSIYISALALHNPQYDEAYKQKQLTSQINSCIIRGLMKEVDLYLNPECSINVKFFTVEREKELQGIMKKICRLSFFENYIKFAKTCEACIKGVPGFSEFIKKESQIIAKLDTSIVQYLEKKSEKYES